MPLALLRAARALPLVAALLLGLVPPLPAQAPPAPAVPPAPPAPAAGADAVVPGSELRVWLVTMGPGALVWELFGHNAIAIENTRTGETIAYNWGIFDFDAEDFYPNFIRGAMQYFMVGYDAVATIESYRRAGRGVWAQELNLAPAERAALLAFVEWNERPENREYRYDYFRDNCSTRVRDAIDRAIGGRLAAALDSVPTGTTYRWHARRLTRVQPWTYAGIEVGLGSPTDHPLTAWEESFLPLQLAEHVRAVRVRQPDGTLAPLVLSERELVPPVGHVAPAEAPVWWPGYLAAGLALAGALVALTRRAEAGRGTAWLAGVGAAWSAVAGIAGALLLFLWLGTAHTSTHLNENVFQFTPLSLPLVVLFPMLVAGRGRTRGGRAARALALVIAAVAVLGALVSLLPVTPQFMLETLALTLPVHLALAWSALRLATRAVPTNAASAVSSAPAAATA